MMFFSFIPRHFTQVGRTTAVLVKNFLLDGHVEVSPTAHGKFQRSFKGRTISGRNPSKDSRPTRQPKNPAGGGVACPSEHFRLGLAWLRFSSGWLLGWFPSSCDMSEGH